MTIRDVFQAGKTVSVGKWIDMGVCSQCGKKIPDVEDEEVGFEGTEAEWEEYQRQYPEYLNLDDELLDVEEKDGIVYGKVYYDYDAEDVEIKLYYKNKVLPFCSEECLQEKEHELWGV